MNTTRNWWAAWLLVLGAAAALGFFLAPPPEAGALPPFTRLTDFYTDASFTSFTGYCFRTCSGVRNCDGTQTSYTVSEFDYSCIGSSYCCIVCSPGPCPANVLNNYPCPEC